MFSKTRLPMFIGLMSVALGMVCVEAGVAPGPQTSAVTVVKMGADHKFNPEKITIKAGQTVEWDNEEPNGIHQVTTDENIAADPGDVSNPDGAQAFDSKLMKTGQSFKHQFTVPGVYKYTCPPHENMGMSGQVTATK